jgi:hypothetical protein
MPSAENAVKIARALDVTAEKLILGEAASLPPDFSPEIKDIAAAACELDSPKRRALLAIARELKKSQLSPHV